MPQSHNHTGEPTLPGRVLVVDDDPDILRVIEATLLSAGHQVDCTSRSADALAIASRTRPDVVIMDLMMPEPSGTDLLELFQSHQETRSIPIVFLSALSDSTVKADLLRQGASDFIGKPFEPEELVARLERLIPRKPHPGSRLEGSIEVYPLSDILQILLRDGRAATLSVESGDTRGSILLEDGKLAGASFGHNLADEAMLTMLDLSHGYFRLEPRHGDLPGVSRPSLGIEGLLMETAWLQDELSRVLTSFSSEDLLIATHLEPPAIPDGFDSLPIHSILQSLGEGARPFQSLATALSVSPLRLRLATGWLLDAGIVAKSAPSEADSDIENRLLQVGQELIDEGVARGFAPGRLPVSFFAPEPLKSQVEYLLRRHFGDSVDEKSEDVSSHRILEMRATMALPTGNLVMGISSLQPSQSTSIDAALEISFAVVVLYQGDSVRAVENLAARIRSTRRRPLGILVPADAAARAHAQNYNWGRQWLTLDAIPKELIEVLDLLSACSKL